MNRPFVCQFEAIALMLILLPIHVALCSHMFSLNSTARAPHRKIFQIRSVELVEVYVVL